MKFSVSSLSLALLLPLVHVAVATPVATITPKSVQRADDLDTFAVVGSELSDGSLIKKDTIDSGTGTVFEAVGTYTGLISDTGINFARSPDGSSDLGLATGAITDADVAEIVGSTVTDTESLLASLDL